MICGATNKKRYFFGILVISEKFFENGEKLSFPTQKILFLNHQPRGLVLNPKNSLACLAVVRKTSALLWQQSDPAIGEGQLCIGNTPPVLK